MVNVSVVIATRNRRALLMKTLEALGAQSWPHARLEVIVADNGSTDDTNGVVISAARALPSLTIRYLAVSTPGKSHAVNAAFDAALGDVFALTDDDVCPDPDWIARLVAAIEETGSDFVGGRIRPNWEVRPPRWMSPAMHGVLAIPDNGDTRVHLGSGASQIMPIGANMAVTRRAVARVGGLRSDLGKIEGSFRTGEDHEFFLRLVAAGFKGVYEPTAVVSHWVPAERLTPSYCRQWLHQNGRDVAQLHALYPEPVAHVAGIPRYLFRQAASDCAHAVGALLTNKPAQRFAATTRLGWMAGYVRESWFGRRSEAASPVEVHP